MEQVNKLVSELWCKEGSLPSTYLGLPLGAPFKSMAIWDRVEERFHKRLFLWKGNSSLKRETYSNQEHFI